MRRHGTLIFVAALAVGSVTLLWLANALLPTQAQSLELLRRSQAMQRFAPIATLVLASIGTFVTLRSWRQRRSRAYRVLSLTPLLGLVIIAVVARRPLVERMFAPIQQTRFVGVAEASFVPGDGMVLGVAVDGAAKAYPVSMLAYHHLVNDELSGEAFVATY